ncbi:hypothetical protein BC628DRAFT_570314 [Trametes gibbosa]|nr:hypothetical protein BC628DRAFT_570314 [Trametes gibbosa]
MDGAFSRRPVSEKRVNFGCCLLRDHARLLRQDLIIPNYEANKIGCGWVLKLPRTSVRSVFVAAPTSGTISGRFVSGLDCVRPLSRCTAVPVMQHAAPSKNMWLFSPSSHCSPNPLNKAYIGIPSTPPSDTPTAMSPSSETVRIRVNLDEYAADAQVQVQHRARICVRPPRAPRRPPPSPFSDAMPAWTFVGPLFGRGHPRAHAHPGVARENAKGAPSAPPVGAVNGRECCSRARAVPGATHSPPRVVGGRVDRARRVKACRVGPDLARNWKRTYVLAYGLLRSGVRPSTHDAARIKAAQATSRSPSTRRRVILAGLATISACVWTSACASFDGRRTSGEERIFFGLVCGASQSRYAAPNVCVLWIYRRMLDRTSGQQ